jgi:hypothetical protein
MSILINPGSRISENEGDGWTNTYEGAIAEAGRWHQRMVDDGFGQDVELLLQDDPIERDGRWVFQFRHRVTGVVVELETHGIDDIDAYMRRHIFGARVYWNGSSCSNPQLDDWAAPGFVQTFRAVDGAAS